jgi:hypothetical protein
LTYVVVHKSSALEENTRVVRELGLVDIGAVLSNVTTIVNLIRGGVEETNALHPVPCLLSPVGIGLVARVSSKSGT